ncbi:MAG TPA: LPS assembly lipoprotein LptE [Xanthomonadaceae bacterium]|nr:LPS assembly lipoprotein LptE [Xanthomonadaceae bacterium]
MRARFPTLRLVPILCFAAAMAACGFQLRGEAELPPELGRVRLEVADPFSPLARDLGNALRRSGSTLTDQADAAALRIRVDVLGTLPLTVGVTGRVQEYVLRYQVEFEVIAADGRVLLPRQRIELSREFSFDTAQAIGSPAEEETMREELRREMVQAIMRRLEQART